jgi:hypothetical protein
MLNAFNETGRQYMFVDFFTRGGDPRMNEMMMKDLGLSTEYEHVKHARELHTKAAAKQQNEMLNRFFGK